MAIVITTPEVPEALTFDHVFLRGLHITQDVTQDGISEPVYALNIDYLIYALDQSGNRHYKKAQYGANVNDYKAAALAQEALGDTRMIEALYAIETALSQIITAKDNIGATSVVV